MNNIDYAKKWNEWKDNTHFYEDEKESIKYIFIAKNVHKLSLKGVE